LTTVPFYFSTAEEFHTHMMYFGVINGPVEGVLIGSILMVVSGITGWSYVSEPTHFSI
jgi:ethanolaminephosphotransferase